MKPNEIYYCEIVDRKCYVCVINWYIYYLFEVILFMLIIVYGQKAFEVWFKKENIPYGGIVVALTWGLAHWFTKGTLMAVLYTAFCGFCFGVVYLLLNRNIKWT